MAILGAVGLCILGVGDTRILATTLNTTENSATINFHEGEYEKERGHRPSRTWNGAE